MHNVIYLSLCKPMQTTPLVLNKGLEVEVNELSPSNMSKHSHAQQMSTLLGIMTKIMQNLKWSIVHFSAVRQKLVMMTVKPD